MVVQGDEVVVAQGAEGSAESWLWLGGLGAPGLPSLSSLAKCSYMLCWTFREKSTAEEEIKENEESIKGRSVEVQVRSRYLCFPVNSSMFPVQTGSIVV